MKNLATSSNIAHAIALCSLIMCLKNCVAQTEPEEVTPKSNGVNKEVVKIQEVDYGKTAVLLCRSNDDHHLFLYWQLAKDDTVVGPGNKFDDRKYNYEILSGNLIIRGVSDEEDGIYHCVSRGVRSNDINIRSVRMVVKKDWDEVEEHDPGVNYFRGVVVVGSLLVIAGAIYFAYRLRRRHRLQSLLEEEDDEEDSAEEIFRAPGTSKGIPKKIVLEKEDDDPVDIPKISIDFEDILTNSHK